MIVIKEPLFIEAYLSMAVFSTEWPKLFTISRISLNIYECKFKYLVEIHLLFLNQFV